VGDGTALELLDKDRRIRKASLLDQSAPKVNRMILFRVESAKDQKRETLKEKEEERGIKWETDL